MRPPVFTVIWDRSRDFCVVRLLCDLHEIAARSFGGSQAENDAKAWIRSLGFDA
jgi:hypothetical protein